MVGSLRRGGRLYLGAGTSGRIRLLDAVECPLTFGTTPEQVAGLLSGGPSAFVVAVEGAPRTNPPGPSTTSTGGVDDRGTLVGLAASGRTPYVIGGLQPQRRGQSLRRHSHQSPHRSRDPHRLRPAQGRHHREGGLQHAFDRVDGPARQGL
ncbi:hypothetical protein [Streptomyces griseicoloratus]|uniref:hypothetical protein n=1 Tax=Streptomyces griseicoloratus TaxID=2752516 RepID=UPI00359C6803